MVRAALIVVVLIEVGDFHVVHGPSPERSAEYLIDIFLVGQLRVAIRPGPIWVDAQPD